MARKRIEFENLTEKDFAWRDFGGQRYGTGAFGLIISDRAFAERLQRDGWNVKMGRPNPNDPDDEPDYWLPVTVRFDKFPPDIIMATRNNEVKIDETNVADLDHAEIESFNVSITPSAQMRAYLEQMYVVINERPLDRWRRRPERNEEAVDDGYPF